MKKALSLLFVCCCSTYGDVVDLVKFDGLDRVETGAIEDCVTIKPGKSYSQSDIDDTLKALFKKDFFSYIKFIKKGNTLVIQCVEKPMVDKVVFEGNDAASDDVLNNVINGRIGEGRLFSLHTIKDILSDFQVAYRALGFCSTIITPKIIKHPGNVVDIVFEIVEGKKTTVKKILFVGNKHFSDDELKDLISTKEEKIWRFWDYESHVFREDKIDVDIENLTFFYKNCGFPFFVVTYTFAEMGNDKESYYCTFSIEEGDIYTIGEVSLDSKISKINADDFKQYISIVSGSVYNEALINANKNFIRDNVAIKDNPFVDVIVDVSYDKSKKTASIKYSIVDSPRVFIERIEIVGNYKTLDRVIRREFYVHEGDALAPYKIQRTVEHLKGIGYFDDVQISDSAGSANDKRVVTVSVKEKDSTAQIQFGLSANDANGFGGFVGAAESNLMGTGVSLSTEIFYMQKQYGCKLDIYDPRFCDKNFGVGVVIGAHQSNKKNIDQSVSKSAYLSPYFSYIINRHLRHRIAYTISFNNRRWWNRLDKKLYNNIPDSVNNIPIMKDEYGKYVCSELSSILSYDMTDNRYDPRNGYSLSLLNTYAGLGGNVSYFKNELHGKYYRPVTKKVTFIAEAGIGIIHEIRGTRSGHRYALGGDGEMGGFDSCGISPRDLHGNSVGGSRYYSLGVSLRAPLSTREIGMYGSVFAHLGGAYKSKFPRSMIDDSSSARISVGTKIEWQSCPLFPVSFIFGFAIRKKPFDRPQTFTLGGGFMQ